MYFKYDRKEANAFAKFLLNKQFNAKNVVNDNSKIKIGLKEIKDYVNSLRESVKYWYYIFNPQQSDFNNKIKKWLLKFDRLGFSSFAPLFMAAMVNKIDCDSLQKLLEVAEKFNFLIFRVTGRPSNTKNSHFYRVANELFKEPTTIDQVIDSINLLVYGDDNNEYPWFNAEDFKRSILEKYDKEEGFYSWGGIRYFLFEYELSLQSNAEDVPKISWSDYIKRKKENSIEHIYPQSATKRCWTKNYSQYSNKPCIQ